MAEHTVRICDWQDDLPDSLVCGKTAPADTTVSAGDVTLSGDLCLEHRDRMVDWLRRVAGLNVGGMKVDSKPRNSYVTRSGKVVATKDMRSWALGEKREGVTQAGRLPHALIQEYLDTH